MAEERFERQDRAVRRGESREALQKFLAQSLHFEVASKLADWAHDETEHDDTMKLRLAELHGVLLGRASGGPETTIVAVAVACGRVAKRLAGGRWAQLGTAAVEALPLVQAGESQKEKAEQVESRLREALRDVERLRARVAELERLALEEAVAPVTLPPTAEK